jgi:hypothetical protein
MSSTKRKEHYWCPDCDYEFTTRAYRIRCPKCYSLNLERRIEVGPYAGQYIKADAAIGSFNKRLIHFRIRKDA